MQEGVEMSEETVLVKPRPIFPVKLTALGRKALQKFVPMLWKAAQEQLDVGKLLKDGYKTGVFEWQKAACQKPFGKTGCQRMPHVMISVKFYVGEQEGGEI